MSFDRPWLLLTLLVIPAAIGISVLAQRRRMRYALTFTNLDLLASVAATGRSWRRFVPPALFLLALGCLCVAVARPHHRTRVPSERATVILVVDVSGSMQATDVKPTRLAAAQQAVRTFLEKVPKRVRVGLIAFAGEPQIATPPTSDRALVRASLDNLAFFGGFGGTAIGDALAAAVDLGAQAVNNPSLAAASTPKTKDLVSILFLSDGHQTRGLLEPLEGAQRAKDAGIRVYTVALGTPNGTLTRDFGGPFGSGFGGPRTIPVPPDPATLRAIAQTTGGQFFNARSADAVQSAYSKLGSRLGRVAARTEITYVFLAAAAGLLLAAAVLSAFWSPRLP
jgi:Ca-activated chloride channel family protein